MTPAIRLLQREGVAFTEHPYEHAADAESFGAEAAAKLGVSAGRIFKTLVCEADDHLYMALIPVAARLNLKALARVLNAKKADLASPAAAERATGYVVGGISPLGGRRRLPTLVDSSMLALPTVFVSAGRRGLQVELAPVDLLRLLGEVSTAALTA